MAEFFEMFYFETFTERDIVIYTPIMKRAFDDDTRRHTDSLTGGPEGYDNGEFLAKWYLNNETTAYKVLKESKPIAAFNVWINHSKINCLGNMFVDPECQDSGVGTVIWKFIETKYSDTIKWCTETPAYSRRNHNFYINKCGFHVVRIDNPKGRSGGSFILEKVIKEI
ncbi:MAG: GNAT family N-acetyltransferase [Oscillospiraceae bacterium]|nr:GNAT family N-acetyltransferase [Oscillospiraceae bacterium]